MKLLVVLSIVAVSAFEPDRMVAVKECIDNYKIEPERIQSILCKGPVNGTDECFLDCAMKKLGMTDDEGNFNVDIAKQEIEECKSLSQEHKDAAVQILDKCRKVECSGECKCGAAILKCLTKDVEGDVCKILFGA